MNARSPAVGAGFALLALLILAAPPASAQLNVQAYAIDHFSSGHCGNGDRTWSEMVGNWYSGMVAFGFHHATRFRVDGDMNRDLFCDPDSGHSDCEDFKFVDSADAVMIAYHGSKKGGHWSGTMREPTADGACKVAAPDASGHGDLFLGDKNAIFFHMSSCQSMTDVNLPNTWRFFEDPVDSPNNGRRLHQADGFHGMMGIGPGYDADYLAFALAGQFESVKDAWMDTMYHPHMANQKCPVAYGVGTSKNDCFNRIDNESYQHVLGDPAGTQEYCYYFYDGCHPAAAGVFTPPE